MSPPKPTHPDENTWPLVRRWMSFLNSYFKSDGSLRRGPLTKHLSPACGKDIGATRGSWNDTLGFWSTVDGTSKLLVPIVLEHGERLREVSCVSDVPTGGTDQMVMQVSRFNLSTPEINLGSESTNTAIELQTITVDGLLELAGDEPTWWFVTFQNPIFTAGATLIGISYVTDFPR